MIFRQTQPQLKVAGGLIDESKNIYPHFDGVYKTQAMVWKFPSGAEVGFRGFDWPKDKGGWQGSQLGRILIDEVAEWDEAAVIFLLSRLRNGSEGGVHPQAILTCNPSKTSFLYKWVEWCLDPVTGVPKPGTEDIIRYFVNVNNIMYWGFSKEELWEKVKDLFRKNPDDFMPKTFRFIPMVLNDNPILQKNNPGYKANLLAQSKIDQLRYLFGSWTATPEGRGYWKRDWVELVDTPPHPKDVQAYVRGWDLAASVPSAEFPDPDYTAGVKISRTRDGTYYIEDVYRFRKRTGEVLAEIINVAKSDGTGSTIQIIPKDPGQAGKHFYAHCIRTLSEHGVATKPDPALHNAGKVARFLPFASLCESGSVKMVRGDWNDEYIEELEAFDGGRKGHNDMCDATSSAFNALSKSLFLPSFSIPDMTKSNGVNRQSPPVYKGELNTNSITSHQF